MHVLQNIAESGAMPMVKTVALRTGNPDHTAGYLLAQEIISLTMGQARPWSVLCHRIIDATIETRETLIAELSKWRKEKNKENISATAGHMDDKAARKAMATASVRVSHCSTIAKACNSGMDRETLATWFKLESEEHTRYLGIDSVYDVAKTFTKTKSSKKGAGFLEKLEKFMETSAKSLDEEDVVAYNKVVESLRVFFVG